jgi:hypothetical protein
MCNAIVVFDLGNGQFCSPFFSLCFSIRGEGEECVVRCNKNSTFSLSPWVVVREGRGVVVVVVVEGQ